jgi:uncharacterized peroxidase-related enzyme
MSMARVAPLDRGKLSEFEDFFERAEQALGFVPNSMLTMGRRPEILRGFAALSGAVFGPGRIPPELKLIAFVSSNASGCRYCQAHTSSGASRMGVSTEKIGAAFEYESNPLFSDAERAALRLANDASIVPNAATDEHFDELGKHFDAEEIVEIMAVIALFGWLNRWNDTMATSLEPEPVEFAHENLAARGWDVGAHADS